MIRPELHTFKWSPKTKSKEDLKLVKDLEQLVKTKPFNNNKTQLTRKALSDFVKKNKKMLELNSITLSRKLKNSKKLN